MFSLLKGTLREIGHSIGTRRARSVEGQPAAVEPADERPDGARDAGWYDRAFAEAQHYHGHYTESGYYFLWTVIADRLLRYGARAILDLGCGPGQLAWLLHDKGIAAYRGIDFSPGAIRMARERGLPFTFTVGDLSEAATLENVAREFAYDCVVTLEFLEHVEFDLDVLRRLRPGTRVVATVPNFPYPSHVRHFRDAGEVRARYESCFAQLAVDSFLRNARGTTYFLMDGIIP